MLNILNNDTNKVNNRFRVSTISRLKIYCKITCFGRFWSSSVIYYLFLRWKMYPFLGKPKLPLEIMFCFVTPRRHQLILLISENNDAFILSYNTLTIGLTRIRYYFYNILFCPKKSTSNIFKISEEYMYITLHRKLVIVPRNVHTVSRISSYIYTLI